MICADCKKEQISTVFCQECPKLDLEAAPGDAFDLFNLEHEFRLQSDLLEDRYLKLSRATHPDHVKISPDLEMRLLEVSSQVNQAYRDLKNPAIRAGLLLGRLLEKGKFTLNQSHLPDGFLLAMLELQEELEEYRGRPEQHEKRLDEIQELMQASILETQRKLGEYFERLEAANRSDHQFLAQKIRSELNTLKYHERVVNETEGLLDDCG
jgi:molecular chaperone HscB